MKPRDHDGELDPRDRAVFYALGLRAHDPQRRRCPGADFKPPAALPALRLRDLLARARALTARAR